MATNWNPNAPSTLGEQWAATILASQDLNQQTVAAAQNLNSTATETINTLRWNLATADADRALLTEVYDLATGTDPTNMTWVDCNPVALSGGRYGSPTPVVAPGNTPTDCIDRSNGATHWLRLNNGTQGIHCAFDATAIPAGKRILRVDIYCSAAGNGRLALKVGDHGMATPDDDIFLAWVDIPTVQNTVLAWSSELCPWTNHPWVQDDLVPLSDGTWEPKWWYAPGGGAYLFWVQVTVTYADETRSAYSYKAASTGDVTFTLEKGANTRTNGWSKVTGHNYRIALRRAFSFPANDSGGSASAYYAKATTAPPVAWGGYCTLVDENSHSFRHLPLGVSTFHFDNRIYSIQLNPGTDSVDSLPYLPNVFPITDTTTAEQRLTLPAGSYSMLMVPVCAVNVGGSELAITVRNHGTSAVLATGTLTAADVAEGDDLGTVAARSVPAVGITAGNGLAFRMAHCVLSAPVSAAGVAVDIEAVRSGDLPLSGGASQGWYLLVEQADASSNGGGTLNGVHGWLTPTAGWMVTGGANNFYADVPYRLLSAPTAPAGFGASSSVQALAGIGVWCNADAPCSIDSLGWASMSWTATALGVNFGCYEVQRWDTYTDWATIFRILDEATTSVGDYEARIGVATHYRVRVIRADGAPSAWVQAAATITLTGSRAELLFTSNEAPAYNLVYNDVYADAAPIRDYSFPEADEVTYLAMHGRDMVVAFHPAERRGVAFSRTLLLNELSAPPRPGPPVMDPIRDLAWSQLAYVCVRDTEGNRWFSSLTIPEGSVRHRDQQHLATVAVREVSSFPSYPDGNVIMPPGTFGIGMLWSP